ncbi:MAG: hypothetical protein J3K34DRAFT_518071 [Monoraphidium minutum]|nr:MAG: hypothetical protein J3K34DRAFT_518071 [Monoraphidium minutum]
MLEIATGDVLLLVLERVAVADVLSLGTTCKALRDATRDDLFWRGLAERKWGPCVLELRAGGAAAGGSWMAYCVKRMNMRTIRRSPLDLGQERFPDPWMHITCCLLCSRTSGSAVVRGAIDRFFELLPTPSSVLAAPEDLLSQIIHPLGLQPVRIKAARGVARDFLAEDWADPSEFYGCGKFVADSWRIFCRGDATGAGVEDRNLKAYVAWAKRTAGGGGAAAGEGAESEAEGEQEAAAAAAPAEPSARAGKAKAAAAAAAGGRDGRRHSGVADAARRGDQRVARRGGGGAACKG